MCYKHQGLQKLNHVNHQVYRAEFAKAEVEHKEPVFVGFSILQFAKRRMLELHYNFFDKFFDVNKLDDLEMDTDSLYLALAEQELTNCVRPEMKAEWENMRSTDWDDCFAAHAAGNFFLATCCTKHKKHDKREPSLCNDDFKCSEKLRLCS